ncbi:GNAT family N-acetyltransferase [Candidatus Saccharibacteria bacterium]|nr:MAG: GNAT family N-acetyltransferase [Candidatus Saccharibacteria bacterium]
MNFQTALAVEYRLLDLLGKDSREHQTARELALHLGGMTTGLFAEMVDSSRILGAFCERPNFGRKIGGIAVYNFPSPKECHLQLLSVTETLRTHGIGTVLLEKVEADARRRGVQFVTATPDSLPEQTEHDPKLVAFFEARGFTMTDQNLLIKPIITS